MKTRTLRHPITFAAVSNAKPATRRQTLEASKARELAELATLHRDFKRDPDYKYAVEWRELRIKNLDWHLSRLPHDD